MKSATMATLTIRRRAQKRCTPLAGPYARSQKRRYCDGATNHFNWHRHPRCRHDSLLSRIGASTIPGAVQFVPANVSGSQVPALVPPHLNCREYSLSSRRIKARRSALNCGCAQNVPGKGKSPTFLRGTLPTYIGYLGRASATDFVPNTVDLCLNWPTCTPFR
jgi:hypothetical protein